MADDTNTAERESFEAWHKTTNWPNDLGRHDGRYNSNIAEASWQAWRARASLAASAGIACQCCGGSGEVFEHSEDCDDDLCALNGDDHSCTGVVRHCSCKASPIAVGATQTHIAAMERAWLWMENQADAQSKGGHATFDLLMLREERDALRAAIDAAASAGSEPVAEIGSAAGDDAEFGQRAVYPLVDIDHLEYGTKLYTHPSPPEGMAGWKWVPIEPTDEMLAAAHDGDREYTLRNFGDVMTVMQGPYDHWAAMIAAAPPLPASEAKEL